MKDGTVIWFTGLSGSGKSTLAEHLITRLQNAGLQVELLDGDAVRTNLSQGLSFSREDRDTNIRRIGYVAHLLSRNGVTVVVAAISPYRETRDEVKKMFTSFVEVYVDCGIDVLTARDTKGLYKRALAGEIWNFTGISDPYEAPINPTLTIHTDQESIEESVDRIMCSSWVFKLTL